MYFKNINEFIEHFNGMKNYHLGYDAYNLGYGANSYMNANLNSKGWNGFSAKEINNYPVVE